MPAGRPTIFTKELGEEICKRISNGESVRRIARDDKMPNRSTILKWLIDSDKKEFSSQYEKACNTRAEELFDEIEEMADDESRDVNRSRLKVDTRKWYLSKVMPKKYGDRLDIDHTSKGDKINGFNYLPPSATNHSPITQAAHCVPEASGQDD